MDNQEKWLVSLIRILYFRGNLYNTTFCIFKAKIWKSILRKSARFISEIINCVTFVTCQGEVRLIASKCWTKYLMFIWDTFESNTSFKYLIPVLSIS